MGRRMRTALGMILVATAMFFASPASADEVEGTLVGTDASDLVVDIGSNQGAQDGMVVELWRRLQVRHPVTGKMITDRFLIGKLRLTQVRPSLALAQPDGAMSRQPTTGDIVRIPGTSAAVAPRPVTPTPAPVPTVPARPPTSSPTNTPNPVTPPPGVPDQQNTPPGDLDALSLSILFESLANKSPEERH